MPVFNGDVVFLDASGQVRASNGDLSLRADDTGTRSIIVGSGVSLRPDRNHNMDLGAPDLRWLRTYTGHLSARSGILGPDIELNEFPFMTWDQDGFAAQGVGIPPATQSFSFIQLDVVLAQARLSLGGGSTMSVEGLADFQGGIQVGIATINQAVPFFDSPENDFARIGGEGERYNGVFACSGVFNHLAPPTSGTFIVVEDGDLVPIVDSRRSIGALSRRWARMHAASGIFNTLGAPASGTRVEVAASLVPNRHNIYSLGTTGQRWANLFATSGTIAEFTSTNITASTVSSNDATIRDLFLDRSLTLNTDGFQISQIGQTFWDLGASSLDFSNGIVNFENLSTSTGASIGGGLSADTLNVSSTASITGTLSTRNIVPQTDRLYGIGTSALRYARMHAASGLFNTIGPQTSGTFTNVIGSLVPELDAIYSLGTSALRWGNLFTASGTVGTLAATTINVTDINAFGNFISNGVAFMLGGTIFGNAMAPSPDATNPAGLQGLRFNYLYAVSGMIETINPLPSGGSLTVNGHIIPDLDDHRALGLSSRRWLRVNAASGTFVDVSTTSLNANNGDFTTLSTDSLSFNNPGASISSENATWNLTGTDITFTDGTVLFDVPYDRAGFASFRPKLNSAPLVTNKEARTTVHAVITANSGAIINSNAERDIYNYTIPTGTLSESGKLVLECIGSFTNMAGANVNLTPRVYINGTAIWGDVLAVSQGPRAADFALYTEILSLGSLTGQRVRGTVELGSRTAGSITGNGDFGTAAGGIANWSSQATSGTVSFSSPVNIRVSMQLGTASTNASYSGFHCILSHQPFPTI